MDNVTISLHLTGSEVSAVVNILAQRPYAEVFSLIAKIQSQANAGLAAQQAMSGAQTDPAPADDINAAPRH